MRSGPTGLNSHWAGSSTVTESDVEFAARTDSAHLLVKRIALRGQPLFLRFELA